MLKVKSAGPPEILLNALTKFHWILSKKTPMFNTNLIQEKYTLSTPAKYNKTHSGLYLDVTISHMIKKVYEPLYCKGSNHLLNTGA
jgi:hypothetical protein